MMSLRSAIWTLEAIRRRLRNRVFGAAPLIQHAETEAFEAQCIPTDASLLAADKYRDFVKERRQRVSERLNDFLMPELA